MNEFQDVIQDIRNANVFSEEAFQYAFENNSYFDNADEAQKELRENPILGVPVQIEGRSIRLRYHASGSDV